MSKLKLKKFEKSVATPLTHEEIALFQALPILTLEQVARVLHKPVPEVYEMSRSRAKRPLPVFRCGKPLCSTWAAIQKWVEDGLRGRAA
jgi:hypothetical protein